MSRIRSKDTKAELIVRRFLHGNGYRYKLHDNKILGKPDIVIPKYETIIDVRGCFWHGHTNCKYGDAVAYHSSLYESRIKPAMERDKRNEKAWLERGYQVIIVWGRCQLEDKKKYSEKRKETLQTIQRRLIQIYEYSSH